MKTQVATARARIELIIICVVFAFYLAFLLKLLILSRLPLTDLSHGMEAAERSVNLVPFGSILEYLRGGSDAIRRFAYSNVIGNVIAFVPLGAFLALLRRDGRIARNLLAVLAASLLVEATQGLLGIGTADIDDVILNGLGGLIGIWGYRLLLLILRNEQRTRTAVAALSVLGLPVLWYYLFMIQLRL